MSTLRIAFAALAIFAFGFDSDSQMWLLNGGGYDHLLGHLSKDKKMFRPCNGESPIDLATVPKPWNLKATPAGCPSPHFKKAEPKAAFISPVDGR